MASVRGKMGSMEQGSISASTSACNGYGTCTLQPKHKVFLAIAVPRKGLWNSCVWTWRDVTVLPFLISIGTTCPLERIFPSLYLKLLNNVKLGWWCYPRSSSLPNGPC